MDYTKMRNTIEKMIHTDHRNFIKALISIEKGIDDEGALDKLYDAYMENDTAHLLNEMFDCVEND